MGHVISLAQQKGGAGKTTVLAHLAHAFSADGARVALLDLDEQGSLTQWHGLSTIPNLSLIETGSYRISGDIRDAVAAHDVVLIDCPGTAASVQEAAIRASNLVISPVQPSPLDRWASSAVLNMAKTEGVPAMVLLNRVPPQGGDVDEARAAFKTDGTPVLKAQLGNRIGFARGFGSGGTVLSLPGQKPAKSEIAAMLREVKRVLKTL